ncbi:MAG TPA: hypothetical protein VL738_27605 [Dactylosporangium sp.]|nr:hypothetical protein [Dactylosporangium sp.]
MNDNPLQLLRDDVAPGTALNPGLLLAAGRRRVRRRRAAITGVAAALVLVATLGVAALAADRLPQPPAHPDPSPTPALTVDPSCRSHALAVSGGTPIEHVVVDTTGRWAAGLRADHRGVVIWHDGEAAGGVQDVDVTSLAGISSSGVAAGTGNDSGGRSRAMTFTGTHATVLTPPAGAAPASFTRASAVNGAGDVAGVYGPGGGGQQAVVWRRADPLHPRLLAAPDNSAAMDISDNGEVGGYVGDIAGRHRPYVWDADGHGRELPLPAGAGDGLVNGLGAGYAFDLTANVRWLTGPGSVEPAGYAVPRGLTGRDVGADGTVLVSGDRQVALVRDQGTRQLPMPAGAESVRGTSMNHDGSVVGGVSGGQPGGLPLLWICGQG